MIPAVLCGSRPMRSTRTESKARRPRTELQGSRRHRAGQAPAYVITIGVDAYQNPKWTLGFAVKDARDLSGALQQIQGYEVVPVPLVSGVDRSSKLDQATKGDIADVLALLGGKEKTTGTG